MDRVRGSPFANVSLPRQIFCLALPFGLVSNRFCAPNPPDEALPLTVLSLGYKTYFYVLYSSKGFLDL